MWAALESRAALKKVAPTEWPESAVDGSGKAFDPLSSMRNDKGAPLVVSVTHDALSGADFWSLVPALYRGLMQHSQIFAHQGLLHEAIHVAEQAEKVASATKSATLMTDNASWRADCWAQSGRPDKAQPILESLGIDINKFRKCISIVGYQSALARIQHWNGRYQDEIATYATLNQLLQNLTSPVYIKTLESFSDEVDDLAEQMTQVKIDEKIAQAVKATTSTRGRKPVAKTARTPAPKIAAKAVPKARSRATAAAGVTAVSDSKTKGVTTMPPEPVNSTSQCSILHTFQAEIAHRQVLVSLLQEDLATASALLVEIEEQEASKNHDLSYLWATFKTMLAQSAKQIAENIAVNTLPESTIAFPAINLNERRLSDPAASKRPSPASTTNTKRGQGKKAVKEDFIETLRSARDRLVEAHSVCATSGPNHMFQQVSMALGTITVLLSAVSGGETVGSLHPLYAAYMGGTYFEYHLGCSN
jgi:separase